MSEPQPRGDRDPERTLSTQYTLTVDGIAEPTTFENLQAAVDTLRTALAALDLDPAQRDAYQWFLGPGGVDRVQDYLADSGAYSLTFSLAGRDHTATIQIS